MIYVNMGVYDSEGSTNGGGGSESGKGQDSLVTRGLRKYGEFRLIVGR